MAGHVPWVMLGREPVAKREIMTASSRLAGLNAIALRRAQSLRSLRRGYRNGT